MDVNIIFDKIQVQSIDTSSGIFVAHTNHAHGWSSQSKINMGFGTVGDSNVLETSTSVVYDDDWIDSPMIDKSVRLQNKQEPGPNQTSIVFNKIDVDTMNTNTTVSVGESSQQGWSSKSKNNYGNGTFIGRTLLPNNKTMVKDDDYIDSPIKDIVLKR
jgi:hypothetical protein